MGKVIVFIDSGDTIIDEGSEVRLVPGGVVQSASCIPGAEAALRELKNSGHTIALVADGLAESFERMFRANGIWDIFSARAISEKVGHEKPHEAMFRTAMDALGLSDPDKKRIVMIGNNIKRDIVGANRFGITSVLMTWSPRYDMRPGSKEETPNYTIASPWELPELIRTIEKDM